MSQNQATPRCSWLVVGGGMMGLKVAKDLLDRDQNVTIAEAAPALGGLASPWQLGETTWDRFYHATLLSDSHLRALLKELGLEKEIRWVETKTGFYSGGKLLSMSNTLEFLKFPPLNLFQRIRLGATIFLASKIKNWRRMEQQTVESWLRRWSGNGAYSRVWLPLLKAKLGEAYQQTSARVYLGAHAAYVQGASFRCQEGDVWIRAGGIRKNLANHGSRVDPTRCKHNDGPSRIADYEVDGGRWFGSSEG